MLNRIARIAAGTAFGFALLLAAPEADAQEVPATQQQAELTDEQLESFAHAYIEVQQIGEEHQAALTAVETPEEAQALQAEAAAAMNEALDEHGLTPDDYTSIVDTLNEDEALRERFAVIISQVNGS